MQEEKLEYTSIRTQEKGAASERIVWPRAMLNYKGRSQPLQLLRTQFRTPDAGMVGRSINNLEYEVAGAIRKIVSDHRPRVAILASNGSLDEWSTKDIQTALSEQYEVSRVRIDGHISSLSDKVEGGRYRANKFEALIVPKPDSAFSDKDAYIIDQFIMNGGRVLWAVDAMNAHLDSLRTKQYSIATPLELGLDKLFFAYGTRLNKELLLDAQCAPIQF